MFVFGIMHLLICALWLKLHNLLGRVLACTTCEVVKPQPNRPTEGKVFFDVDLSPMASPAFEVGRLVHFIVILCICIWGKRFCYKFGLLEVCCYTSCFICLASGINYYVIKIKFVHKNDLLKHDRKFGRAQFVSRSLNILRPSSCIHIHVDLQVN